MRICPKCNIKKIKNGYQQCYDCNNKMDTSSEPETSAYIKEPINKPDLRRSKHLRMRKEECAHCYISFLS